MYIQQFNYEKYTANEARRIANEVSEQNNAYNYTIRQIKDESSRGLYRTEVAFDCSVNRICQLLIKDGYEIIDKYVNEKSKKVVLCISWEKEVKNNAMNEAEE